MNRSTKYSFDAIQSAIEKYKSTVTETLTTFRVDREAAKAFKDEQAHLDAAKSRARKNLSIARDELSKVINDEKSKLRSELVMHLALRPGPAFLDAVRTYAEFGISPTKLELEGLLTQSLGSSVGLAALNSMLERTNSKYRVDFVTPESFEHDMEILDTLADNTMFSPAEYASEMNQLFNGASRFINGIDNGHKWNTVSIATAISVFDANSKSIGTMSTRWNDNITPSIRSLDLYTSETGDDGKTRSPASQLISDIKSTGADASIRKDPISDFAKAQSEANADAADVRARYFG